MIIPEMFIEMNKMASEAYKEDENADTIFVLARGYFKDLYSKFMFEVESKTSYKRKDINNFISLVGDYLYSIEYSMEDLIDGLIEMYRFGIDDLNKINVLIQQNKYTQNNVMKLLDLEKVIFLKNIPCRLFGFVREI